MAGPLADHCLKTKLDVDVFPAFDYAREAHTTTILEPVRCAGDEESRTVTFHSAGERLQLDVVVEVSDDEGDGGGDPPDVRFEKVRLDGMKGEGVRASITLREGRGGVSFVLRRDDAPYPSTSTGAVTAAVLDAQQRDTQLFWSRWLSRMHYRGRWREVVSRSLMILKMLTYEPTGAIVAAPTFSIPEAIGGARYVFTLHSTTPRTSPPPLVFSFSACGKPNMRNKSKWLTARRHTGIGTTAFRGSGTRASPSTSCSGWGSPRRRTRTWSSSTRSSRGPRPRSTACASCTRSGAGPRCRRRSSATSTGTRAAGRCASATGPRPTSSSTYMVN